MSKKFVRNELRKNLLAKNVGKTVKWALNNKENMGIGLLVLTIFVIFIFVVIQYNNKMNEKAFEILSQGENQYYQKKYQEALTSFKNIYDDYKNTKAVPFALFYEGCLLYDRENYEDAIKKFKNYLTNYRNKFVTPEVLNCMGNAYEQLDNYIEATTVYKKFIDEFDDHHLTPTVYQGLARAYLELGNKQEAVYIYKKIGKLYNNSIWAELATSKIKTLKNKN